MLDLLKWYTVLRTPDAGGAPPPDGPPHAGTAMPPSGPPK
jgi:hypothetical protein